MKIEKSRNLKKMTNFMRSYYTDHNILIVCHIYENLPCVHVSNLYYI